MKKAKKYHGVIPPIISPVDKNEDIDEDNFRALIERCVQKGLHGIFVAGTNGECMQLTQKEREHAIRIAIDQVQQRLPVVCGIMDSSTRRVIDNLKALEQLGGKCAVVTSVFYARHTSQNETIRHFERISQESNIDIIIYNMPSMTGLVIAPETIFLLGEMDHVVGYKDSGPSFSAFIQVLSHFRETDFACLQGITAHAISALLIGADGFIPALAPLFPELFVEAYQAGISGNVELAMKYNELLLETSKILSSCKNMTAAAKYAISTVGFSNKRVIMPQDKIVPEEEQKIDKQIQIVNEMFQKYKENSNGIRA